jgi:hypothetical protein
LEKDMKRGFKGLLCALGLLALALEVHAAINPSDTPYYAITNRNIFDLHEPPPLQLGTPTNQAPPSNVKLTGLTTILGYPQAVFTVTEHGKPQPITIVLVEGQMQNGIELVNMNMQDRSANIKNEDRPEFLRLDEKAGGAPAGGGAAVAGVTAPNPALGGRGVPPGGAAGAQAGNQFTYGAARGAGANGGTASPFNPQGTASALPAGTMVGDQVTTPFGGTVPSNPNTTRPVRTDNGASLTPEQQIILIEAQRAQGGPTAPLLPPTPLTPLIQQDQANSQQNNNQSAPPSFPSTTGPSFNQPKGWGTLVPGK